MQRVLTVEKGNLALGAVLLFTIAMNIWSTVQLNQARGQILDLFCIEHDRH